MNRIKSFSIIVIIGIMYILFTKTSFRWECIFEKVFHLSCPGCGLTRSVKSILDFRFIDSIKYNILGIPIFILVIYIIIISIKDIIKNENTILNIICTKLTKYYKYIVLLLIITMIINNVNGI